MEKISINKIILLFLVLSMFSCRDAYEFDTEEAGFLKNAFSSFNIKKRDKNFYDIKFDFDECHNGILEVTEDTVFVVFDIDTNLKRIPLFIKGNYMEKTDTIVNKKECRIFMKKKFSVGLGEVCNTELVFPREFFGGTYKYNFYFSFEKGIVQIIQENGINRKILTLYPKKEIKTVVLRTDIGTI